MLCLKLESYFLQDNYVLYIIVCEYRQLVLVGITLHPAHWLRLASW